MHVILLLIKITDFIAIFYNFYNFNLFDPKSFMLFFLYVLTLENVLNYDEAINVRNIVLKN